MEGSIFANLLVLEVVKLHFARLGFLSRRFNAYPLTLVGAPPHVSDHDGLILGDPVGVDTVHVWKRRPERLYV